MACREVERGEKEKRPHAVEYPRLVSPISDPWTFDLANHLVDINPLQVCLSASIVCEKF